MSTPFDIFGVIAAAGSLVVAALYLPSGLTTSAGTTINGGTVSGTTTVPTSATQIFLGLTENPTTIFEGSSLISGTLLPDTTIRPYTIVARVIAAGTNMTSYSAIASAFAAATAAGSVAYTRDVPATIGGGFLKAGIWFTQVELDMTQPIPTYNTEQTVGDALNAARAQGFGKWIISGTSLILYAGDGTTVVRTFTLNNAIAPTIRA